MTYDDHSVDFQVTLTKYVLGALNEKKIFEEQRIFKEEEKAREHFSHVSLFAISANKSIKVKLERVETWSSQRKIVWQIRECFYSFRTEDMKE